MMTLQWCISWLSCEPLHRAAVKHQQRSIALGALHVHACRDMAGHAKLLLLAPGAQLLVWQLVGGRASAAHTHPHFTGLALLTGCWLQTLSGLVQQPVSAGSNVMSALPLWAVAQAPSNSSLTLANCTLVLPWSEFQLLYEYAAALQVSGPLRMPYLWLLPSCWFGWRCRRVRPVQP